MVLKHKLNFLSCLIALVISGSNVSAQNSSDCEDCMAVPLELRNYVKSELMDRLYNDKTGDVFDELDYRYSGSKEKRNRWVVYSDRPENALYSSPEGKANGKELGYMQRCYVTDREGSWLRLTVLSTRTSLYEDYGWIPARNLVLTNFALTNRSNITKKGLVLVNLDDISEFRILTEAAKEGQDLKEYTFYFDPQLNYKKDNSQELQIRYVMKELEGVKLLSKLDRIDNLSSKDLQSNVNGWMKNVHITDWYTRVCLEPNYGPAVADPKVYGDKSIPVFIEETELRVFMEENYGQPSGNIYEHSVKKDRKTPFMMRMPILEIYPDSDIRKVATLGSVGGASGDERNEIKAQTTQAIEALQSKKKNLNILYVVDGTSSMRKFFPEIKRGIQKLKRLNDEIYKKNIRYSIAVYRDYKDGRQAFSNIPLTGDVQKIYNFLGRTSVGSKGTSLEEAQYNGIIEGLQQSGMDPDQSNIVILIGDAGNKNPDERNHTKETVYKELLKYNASLIVFQIYYNYQSAYQSFNRDAMEYIYGMGELTDAKGELIPNVAPVEGIPNSYQLLFKDPKTQEKKFFAEAGFARFVFANDREYMKIDVLQENLAQGIELYVSALDEQIEFYKDKLKPSNARSSNAGELLDKARVGNLKKYLMREGLSEDEIEVALQAFPEFSMSGYTSVRFYQQDKLCYKPVVFLSADELINLTKILDGLDLRNNSTDTKEAVANALIETTKASLGESNSKIIEKMTIEEVWTTLFAFPFDEKNQFGDLREVRLGKLANSRNDNADAFFQQFVADALRFNLDRFNSSDPKRGIYPSRFKLNGRDFYWIPIDEFPGNGTN